jgi:cation transport ATPase
VLDDHDSRDILPLCAALAKTSTHPFSKAVVQFVEEWPASNRAACTAAETRDWNKTIDLKDVRSVPGGGVEAFSTTGKQLRLGSLEFVTDSGDISPRLRLRMAHALSIADQEAASVVAVSVASRPVIMFLLTETMRPESSETVKRCMELDLPVTVLTGDRAAKAEQLRRNLLDCHEVGCQCSAECASSNAHDHDHHHDVVPAPAPSSRLKIECDLRPEQKVRHLREIRERCSTVAMVGDGINDAPALAVSDVGIAMGCGADVSRDSAQVCLLSNDLSRIPWAVQLARRTTRVIRQNLFWAFGYNFAGVVLAAFGLLNPAVAAGLMIISSLMVITNSLRLMADSPDSAAEQEQPTTGLIAARTVSSNTSEKDSTGETTAEPSRSAVLPSPHARLFDPESDAAPPRSVTTNPNQL